MPYKTPKDIAKAGIETGSTKARLSWDKALVAGFLAGAYIAIAGLLAIVVSAGMPPEWGGLVTLLTGAVFSLGLILVIVAGSELLTGNMALVPLAAMTGRASFKRLAENWAIVLFGNLLGALFVAWLLGSRPVSSAGPRSSAPPPSPTRRAWRRRSGRSSPGRSAATG